ncbi:hypothetical protein BMETH_1705_0 [methanotrophic bacterial endosymbiont of Bathymodiolus sp.]|nr:hypothetical protein BMETH_1705_0 [methanotrophic bacterial endosymbiont of Bathymodiolus sp.]
MRVLTSHCILLLRAQTVGGILSPCSILAFFSVLLLSSLSRTNLLDNEYDAKNVPD